MTSPWQRAVVVGASSGIGEAVARRLVAGGCSVALVARRADVLARLAAELGPERARPYAHDVVRIEAVAGLVETVERDLGGLDLLVYASGIMPRVGLDEWDPGIDAAVAQVNLIGAMAWVDAVAPRFAAAGRGTIVGVSSVAGDRGRRGNPAYHASKAGLDAYLEAVRHRVARHGVRVVTAKPGPVDTPMSRGLPRLPLLVSADTAAAGILRAARRGPLVRYIPGRWRPIMFVIRNLPGPIFRRLDL